MKTVLTKPHPAPCMIALLEPEAPAVNEEEAHYQELVRRHGW